MLVEEPPSALCETGLAAPAGEDAAAAMASAMPSGVVPSLACTSPHSLPALEFMTACVRGKGGGGGRAA